eukprot:jgi/Bigna1/67608/fgenesh1_pg.4_\
MTSRLSGCIKEENGGRNVLRFILEYRLNHGNEDVFGDPLVGCSHISKGTEKHWIRPIKNLYPRSNTGGNWRMRGGRRSASYSFSDENRQQNLPPGQIVRTGASKALNWVDKNFLLAGIGAAITIAHLFPNFGASGGAVQLDNVSKLGVLLVFLIQGTVLLGKILRDTNKSIPERRTTVNTTRAIGQGDYVLEVEYCDPGDHVARMLFSFGVLPLAAYSLATMLGYLTNIDELLLTGITALGCLPTTINMCVVLTEAAGGDRALAVLNAVFGNVLGVFLTPFLFVLLLGKSMALPYAEILLKLARNVLLPIALGQMLQKLSPQVRDFRKRRKKWFSRTSETALVLVVLNTFSDTFSQGLSVPLDQVASLFAILPIFYASSVIGSLVVCCEKLRQAALMLFLRNHITNVCLAAMLAVSRAVTSSASQRVAATFTATQKTLAFGLPLMQTVFGGTASMGAITAPLLIYHPMQMVAGALMQPFMKKEIEKEQAANNDGPASEIGAEAR